jgi:hypothetical protein
MRAHSRWLVVAFVVTLSFPVFVRAQSGDQDGVRNAAQNLVRQHEAWERISTPGASVELKVAGRDGPVVRYNIFVVGLPADQLYSVVSWPVTEPKPITLFEGVSLGKNGLVMCTGRRDGECKDPSDPSDPDFGIVDLAIQPAKGEPFRLAVVAGEKRAAVVIVPNPINAKDKQCILDAVRLTPHFELTYLTGKGYSPNTKISFESESLGEKRTVETRADAEGRIRFAVLPFVEGHAHGTTKIHPTDISCSPALQFDWGQ